MLVIVSHTNGNAVVVWLEEGEGPSSIGEEKHIDKLHKLGLDVKRINNYICCTKRAVLMTFGTITAHAVMILSSALGMPNG